LSETAARCSSFIIARTSGTRTSRGRPQLAPYPIIIDDSRVTEEDAPVLFLQPKHPLLNFPNRITQKDFANWVQERGLYFPREWDPQYTAVLSDE
jgi:hypothetical protein